MNQNFTSCYHCGRPAIVRLGVCSACHGKRDIPDLPDKVENIWYDYTRILRGVRHGGFGGWAADGTAKARAEAYLWAYLDCGGPYID